MEFVVIALILLFLPGLSIIYLTGLDKYRYLFSFSLSYSLFVLLLRSTAYFGLDIESFKLFYFLLIFSLFTLAAIKIYRTVRNNKNTCTVKYCSCHNYAKSASLYILILVTGYFLLAGPYVELPSDIFKHLEYMQNTTREIFSSENTGKPITYYIGQNGRYWHYLYSFISIWSGYSLHEAILPASYFNVSVFLLGLFFFSMVVFRGMQPSPKILVFTSLAAVFFTFFHFGINIFSFIRYYALAPVILNFVLYFSVMAVIIDFYRSSSWNIKYLIVAGIIFYTSQYIHRQETLFIILMICIMSFYLFFQKHLPSLKLIWEGEGKRIIISPVKIFTDKINISFLITQTMMLSVFIYSYVSISSNPITRNKLIPVENIFPFFKNMYILNPGFQFYNVVTVWGVLVILLFVFNIKKFRNNAFLMAGMMSPFFTVFNPFFTDLFLRHSWGDMLWRMTFLIPIHLVGAYLLVSSIQYIQHGGNLKKAYGIVTALLLIVFLMPVKTNFLESPYSRVLTLKPVRIENSPEHWSDLIEYLNGIKKHKKIITDPVTGYMLTALTKHTSSRAKFHRKGHGYIEYNFDDYSNNPFDRYKGYLFIINKRNGGMSKAGRIARHWPENILQVENFYFSENLESYISSNPERFQLLWNNDRVRVYQIEVPRI